MEERISCDGKREINFLPVEAAACSRVACASLHLSLYIPVVCREFCAKFSAKDKRESAPRAAINLARPFQYRGAMVFMC